ncbi:triosephosphate isomerase [Legionella birminghamensis]|uniref:Triosephosphate isomerase n=1 Tax=Legionella birminghamensis TaxID=28083 RepID=A0A378I749_9GAMM|nr:triose-phosphate isomerase [Legionella birminghamensis]KTC72443.1 triosephosphate isomerase [Legionella birminghamensis]STX30575.1 triosephosphate isomerase [Legionella birminghamensis]
MRKKIVAGNWKMNGQIDQVRSLLHAIVQGLPENLTVDCVIMPAMLHLPLASEILRQTPVFLGAQNLYPKDYGAYTGEISAPMVKEYNCRYAMVGHSERRRFFSESENFVADKFHHVKEHDMIPILCVGETLTEREQGLTEQVVARQIRAVANKEGCFKNCVIAYEPVWAIGTGVPPSPEEVQAVHQFIRELVAEYDSEAAALVTIAYGGSVNDKNAAALFGMSDVDGVLAGGASLNAQQFVEIVKCIN